MSFIQINEINCKGVPDKKTSNQTNKQKNTSHFIVIERLILVRKKYNKGIAGNIGRNLKNREIPLIVIIVTKTADYPVNARSVLHVVLKLQPLQVLSSYDRLLKPLFQVITEWSSHCFQQGLLMKICVDCYPTQSPRFQHSWRRHQLLHFCFIINLIFVLITTSHWHRTQTVTLRAMHAVWTQSATWGCYSCTLILIEVPSGNSKNEKVGNLVHRYSIDVESWRLIVYIYV